MGPYRYKKSYYLCLTAEYMRPYSTISPHPWGHIVIRSHITNATADYETPQYNMAPFMGPYRYKKSYYPCLTADYEASQYNMAPFMGPYRYKKSYYLWITRLFQFQTYFVPITVACVQTQCCKSILQYVFSAQNIALQQLASYFPRIIIQEGYM